MKTLLRKFLISFYSIWITGMVLLFAIAITGCSTTKKVEKVKTDIALNSTLESKKKVDETTNVKTAASGETDTSRNTQSSENQSKETETNTTKYDTSQPIVPGTGKPPVAEQTTTKEKILSKKDNKILEETKNKYNLQVEENKRLKQTNDSILSIKAKESSKSETKETTSFPWWKWFLAGMCVPVAIGLLVKFGTFSKLFVFVLKIFKVRK